MMIRTTLGWGAAAVVLATSGPVAAACTEDLQAARQELGSKRLSVGARLEARSLLRAGQALSSGSETEELCAQVIERLQTVIGEGSGQGQEEPAVAAVEFQGLPAPLVDIEELLDMAVIDAGGERVATISRIASEIGATGEAFALLSPSRTGVGLRPVPFDALLLAYAPETLRAAVEGAEGGEEGVVLAPPQTVSDLLGRDVFNVEGEEISEVDDVVVMTGDLEPLIVFDVGGFLGIGDKEIAVPLDNFTLVDDTLILETDLTADQFEAAPDFDPEAAEQMDRSQILSDIESFTERQKQAAENPISENFTLDDKVFALDLTAAQFAKAPMLEDGSETVLSAEIIDEVMAFYAMTRANPGPLSSN